MRVGIFRLFLCLYGGWIRQCKWMFAYEEAEQIFSMGIIRLFVMKSVDNHPRCVSHSELRFMFMAIWKEEQIFMMR